MKKIMLLLGCAISGLGVGTEAANAARHSIGMSANIPGFCSIGPVNSANGFTSGLGTALVATAVNGLAVYKLANLTLPYNCSSSGVSFKLTSTNVGITKPGIAPSGQTNKIYYTARITEGSLQRLSLNTATCTVPVVFNNTSSPVSSLTLDIEITPGTLLLVPGSDYADTLHLDVDANP